MKLSTGLAGDYANARLRGYTTPHQGNPKFETLLRSLLMSHRNAYRRVFHEWEHDCDLFCIEGGPPGLVGSPPIASLSLFVLPSSRMSSDRHVERQVRVGDDACSTAGITEWKYQQRSLGVVALICSIIRAENRFGLD